MDLGISGKRAAVAAASAGLGFASAKALADDGVHVVICGRDRARVDAAAAAIGHGCIPLVADVATADGATDFVARATEALGGLDILVANGGGPPPGTFATLDLDAYRAAFESNAMASIAMVRAAIPGMQAQHWGRVVAITSAVVKMPAQVLMLSNTARAALTGFLKTAAIAVAADGVTVNSALPGAHLTDRIRKLNPGREPDASAIPVRAIGRPEDFGAAVAFLCSDQARFITGTALAVDGGAYPGLW